MMVAPARWKKLASASALAPALMLLAVALPVAAQSPAPARALIDRYCTTCHNAKLKTGGLDLTSLNLTDTVGHAEVWERVIEKLRSGTMPPAGSRRPDRAAYKEAADWMEARRDEQAQKQLDASRPALHRLNRTEYSNAIRDLLALEVDASALLPPDDSAFGFDNVAAVLGVSPSLQQQYVSAALKVAALAVGDKSQPPSSQTWRIRQDLSQNQHLEGLPFGTVGGTAVRYNFPLDGDYELRATLYRTNLNIVRGLQARHQVEFSIDGKRAHLASFGGPDDLAALFEKPTETGDAVNARMRAKVHVAAGPHMVTAAFVDNTQSAEPVRLQPFERSSVDNFDWAGHPHLQTLTVAGPFDEAGPGDTPSRRRIFACRPARPAEEEPCARRIVSTLVRRAYRQPAAEADVTRALRFYESGRRTGSFDAGIQAALERILASPKFLFRAEQNSSSATPVAGVEMASRLSFFLWSSIPDDTLIDLGSRGRLSNAAVVRTQLGRMLGDPRAAALVSNFAGQWLQLRNLRTFQPNTDIFPDFDDNLRQGFQKETELLFQSIIAEDRSVLDLMTADYTFVNERLARHYGIPDVYGSRFRRVAVTDEARRGLLGQGSVLALTSHAERTSPVVRGKWILENLLGQSVQPPPADVPKLKERAEGERPKTMREQMAEHRANAVCAACHKTLDPIGFALENFNAVGAWRASDAGVRIDASGELADGEKIDGVVELRKAILREPSLFATAFTKKLMTYALGRGLDYRDMPEVRAIVRNAVRDNYRFSAILAGVVQSAPFRMSSPLQQ